MNEQKDTYFASPDKTGEKELANEILIVNNNPVMTGLLLSISGLLAVLDENRQVIAFNNSFLNFVGIDNQADVLGLRPGQIVNCIHGNEKPAGCGTTKYCSTCGAAIAIVSSLGQNESVERICSLTAKRGDATIDIALLVRSQPVNIDKKRFLLLFLQDITIQQQRAALERTFFHDINNMLSGLIGLDILLKDNENDKTLANKIQTVSLRLAKEVEMQNYLINNAKFSCDQTWQDLLPAQVMEELKLFFTNHITALNKKIFFSKSVPSVTFKSDLSLLMRVLCNMVTNALEASDEKTIVKVWIEQEDNLLSFCVWNDKEIKEEIKLRIFQRNFSTKDEAGRGIGTYSMKLFGETMLGGKVSFTTGRDVGTTFIFSLPF